MDEQRYKLKKDIARRIKILHLTFTGIVVFFLFYILVFVMFNGEVSRGFDEMYNASILSTEVVPAHRGSIYSRNGEVLATSITRKTLLIDFGSQRFDNFKQYRKNADTLARKLAAYFGDRSSKEYYEELIKYRKAAIKQQTVTEVKSPKWYQFWKQEKRVTKEVVTYRKHITRRLFRDVDINEWHEIRNFPLLRSGLGSTYRTEDHDYRVYPQGNIALRTIGRLEHHRSYGIEYALRDTLAGHDGRQLMQTISPGYNTRVTDKNNIEPQNGYDVVTTLDIDVQDMADHALREQLLAQNAIWGTTIVMECATGDILAMANLKRNGSECVEEQNYAIGIPVNPGSTFKLVSTMALLEHGVPTSKEYNSELGKRVRVGGKKGANVQDSHAISRETGGVIDMRRAFSESANVYFTKAVFDRFGNKPVEFSDFCRKLHLHETVGLEEMGARKKPLPHLNNKHHSRYNALVNMAYGYGLEITPLHTIALYNAVANNGRMVAPRLILRTERDGKVVSEAPVRVIEEQICSKSTIDTLRSFMEEVSLTGTAAEFFGEKKCSFRTGAKTGTAQVDSEINGVRYKRGDGYYYGSMVTYLPADNPRYTIMTAIFTKRQTGKFYYGASLTGPVQKQVATFLHNRDRQYAEVVAKGKYNASNIKGGNIDKMRKVVSEYGDKYVTESRHGWGKGSVGEEGKLQISTLETREGGVPNVIGMGLDDALYLLEKSGLAVDIVGYGKVVKQSISPNTAVANTNKRITITLK
ncbi:MAG: transpeptidase family protein [Rikenellaceae bacterium]|nr:transpeptidase family protein [Alistipes sp.]MBP3550481.1 transpeptidase family protein [Alistipes sp.]MBR2442993.1 transpeptidase family protein [Rikenellaceae bacterium]